MGKKRILVIDGDLDFVNLIKPVFEEGGFEVATAATSREGLGAVAFEAPDAIIVDLALEKHDAGFDFSKAVKADPRYQKIPVLMTAAASGESKCEFCQELDGYWMKTDDFVNKPITAEDLLKRVNNLLAK